MRRSAVMRDARCALPGTYGNIRLAQAVRMRAPGGRSRREWESLMKLCVRMLGVLLSLFVMTAVGLGAVASVAATTRTSGAPSLANSARSVSLSETAHLHLTSKHEFTLNEE